MTIEYSEAPQSILSLAQKLIEDHHPNLQEANIAFVMRSEAQQGANGKVVAHTTRVKADIRVYADYDFLVWIAEDAWQRLTDKQRSAVIDHELCHMGGNVDTGWSIRPHDINEFRDVLARHGMWNDRLALSLAPVISQLELPIEEEPQPHAGSVTTITFTPADLSVIARAGAEMRERFGAEVEVS